MGYTHYWKMGIDAPQDLVDQAVEDCNKIIEANKGVLAGWNGSIDLEIYPDQVSFNGREEMSHETFAFPPERRVAFPSDDPGLTFSFCKTARKTYDTVVTACLAAIKDRMRSYIEVSSDGYAHDWESGVRMASKVLDREIANPIEEY